MLLNVSPYVFPSADYVELGVAVANRLKDMLLQGHAGSGQAGLQDAPEFLNREGRGSGRDKSHSIKAQVVFYNDQLPGTPFVQILGIQRASESEWGDGLKLVNCVAALDCYTNQFMPNSITPRQVTARTAQDVLGNFVEAMLRNEKCMAHWGFTDVSVSPSAPPDLTDKDGLPWTFHYPLQVSFEIYAENPFWVAP